MNPDPIARRFIIRSSGGRSSAYAKTRWPWWCRHSAWLRDWWATNHPRQFVFWNRRAVRRRMINDLWALALTVGFLGLLAVGGTALAMLAADWAIHGPVKMFYR